MQNFTSVILYMNIKRNTQWLFGANLEILDCSADFTRCQKLFNKRALSNKHVSIFLPRKYNVISQVRPSYAKGLFCVARIN